MATKPISDEEKTTECVTCGCVRVIGAVCRTCANRRNREWKAKNAEKVRASASAYKKKKYADGAEDRKAKKAAKKATVAERRRVARLLWKEKNKHRLVESCAARQAAKLRAVPGWLNKERVDEFYALSARLTAMVKGTPIECRFHVDHIVPLRNKTVCGLHVHDNLRVVPDFVNMKKGNRSWPDDQRSGDWIAWKDAA